MNQQTARHAFMWTLGLLVFALSACGGTSAPPAAYLPPTRTLPTETATPQTLTLFTPAPELLATQAAANTPAAAPPSPAPECANNLTFIADLTVRDGSIFAPGAAIDKRWQVQNTGTCNWGPGYRVRLFTGDPLGAASEYSLYPARAGTTAEIAILFTAPDTPGAYRSDWLAYGPDGVPFGQPVYIEIFVQSP